MRRGRRRPWYYYDECDRCCCCCCCYCSPLLSLCAYMLLALAHGLATSPLPLLLFSAYTCILPPMCEIVCVRACVRVYVCMCVCVCVCVRARVRDARVGVLLLLSSPSPHHCSHYQPSPYTDSLTTLTCTQPLPALLLIQCHATE
jgi:hypothetical protein